jgi:L-lactate utilization protein LutC
MAFNNLFEKLRSTIFPKDKDDIHEDGESSSSINDSEFEDVIFAKTLNENNGKFFYCENTEEVKVIIKDLIAEFDFENIFCKESELQNILTSVNIPFKGTNFASCDVILSSCEYLIADQGKVMLSTIQLGPENVKDLPNKHMVLAYTDQVVKNISEGMRALNKRTNQGNPTTITTIGAQGTKEIFVFMIDEKKGV